MERLPDFDGVFVPDKRRSRADRQRLQSRWPGNFCSGETFTSWRDVPPSAVILKDEQQRATWSPDTLLLAQQPELPRNGQHRACLPLDLRIAQHHP